VVKMTMIARDLMHGIRLAELVSARKRSATTPSPAVSRATALTDISEW